MALKKVQVWLTDAESGEFVEQVNTITAPDAVIFADGKNLTEKLSDIELTPGPTGAKGDKGDAGAPFKIKKIYASIATMNADYAGTEVAVGEFVLIETGNVEDDDNAKLYCKGASAYTFITDLSGAQGIQGPKGDAGVQGIQGIQGLKGATSAAGAQGPQGVKGDTGATGAAGAAATLTVGTVTTGAAGTNASVTNAGTANAAKFNFTIPRGAAGAVGAKGDKGDPGDKVKVGTTLETAVQRTLFFKVV